MTSVVFSGGGSLAVTELGAFSALQQRYEISAAVGTSAGALVAATWAVGLSPEKSLVLFRQAFAGGVLDPSLTALPRFGAHLGDRIHRLLKTHLPGTMGSLRRDLKVVVCNLWNRQAEVVSPETHPDVLVADAVRCSISIPGFFAAARLRPDNATLYVDGGLVDNFPLGLALDAVGVQVISRGDRDLKPVRVWDYAAYGRAIGSLLLQSAPVRLGSRVLTIETDADPFDFTLTSEEVTRRYDEGYRAAKQWDAGWQPPLGSV